MALNDCITLIDGAPKIAKLVNINPISMVFIGDISIVNGLLTHL